MTKKKAAPSAGIKKVNKMGSDGERNDMKKAVIRKGLPSGKKPATKTASHKSAKRPKQQMAAKSTNQFPVKTTAAAATKKKLTVGKTNI